MRKCDNPSALNKLIIAVSGREKEILFSVTTSANTPQHQKKTDV